MGNLEGGSLVNLPIFPSLLLPSLSPSHFHLLALFWRSSTFQQPLVFSPVSLPPPQPAYFQASLPHFFMALHWLVFLIFISRSFSSPLELEATIRVKRESPEATEESQSNTVVRSEVVGSAGEEAETTTTAVPTSFQGKLILYFDGKMNESEVLKQQSVSAKANGPEWEIDLSKGRLRMTLEGDLWPSFDESLSQPSQPDSPPLLARNSQPD